MYLRVVKATENWSLIKNTILYRRGVSAILAPFTNVVTYLLVPLKCCTLQWTQQMS